MKEHQWDIYSGQNKTPAGPTRKQFEQLEASALYCPRCKRAVPVRKRLLLVLPGRGDKYEYLCAQCSSSVGTKIEETTQNIRLIYP